LAFGKIEKENLLLNNFINASTPVKKMKVSFAVTSFKNIISMIEQMSIINEKKENTFAESCRKKLICQ